MHEGPPERADDQGRHWRVHLSRYALIPLGWRLYGDTSPPGRAAAAGGGRRPGRGRRRLRAVVLHDVPVAVVGPAQPGQGLARLGAGPGPAAALLAPLPRPAERRPVRDGDDTDPDAVVRPAGD